jgi:hypothetical protein
MRASNYFRFDCPRDAFFSFCLFSPRAPTRGPFGAAFFRAARFSFFRSCTSSILVVSIVSNLFQKFDLGFGPGCDLEIESESPVSTISLLYEHIRILILTRRRIETILAAALFSAKRLLAAV